jgi:signal transduction histidine kinase
MGACMPNAKIQRLEKQLKGLRSNSNKSRTDRKKVDILGELTSVLLYSNPDRAKEYGEKALVLAKKIRYKEGIAGISKKIGIIYFLRNDYDRAMQYSLNALRIYEDIKDKKGISACYNNIGNFSAQRGDFDQALGYHLKALNVWQEIGDKALIAQSCQNIGKIHSRQGDFDRALEFSIKSAKLYEEIGDKRCMAMSYLDIGSTCAEQGDYETGLLYLSRALEAAKESGDKRTIEDSYNNVANIYTEKGDYDKAINYYSKSLEINKKTENKINLARLCNNIGEVHARKGDHSQSLVYFLRSLQINQETGDKYSAVLSCRNIGEVCIQLKAYDAAFSYLQNGLQLAKKIGVKHAGIGCLRCLSLLYETRKEYAESLAYYKRSNELEKEVFNTEKSEQITEMRTKYETEKKEKEVEIYQLKNVELRKEIRRRKKAERELKKHRDQLEELVAERTAQLRSLAHELSLVEEKQRREIATYLHDEINQAMALATFKIESLQEISPAKNIKRKLNEIKEHLEQTTQRIRSLTFEISPPILYELGLEPAIEWLLEQFGKQYNVTCKFKDDGLPKPMADDARILLFQSVRELLTNISKHANARNIKVSTLKDGNIMRIAVEDDGVGFNPEVLEQKISRNQGFGLFNVKERLRHLQGNLDIESRKGAGTSIILVAPLERTKKATMRR